MHITILNEIKTVCRITFWKSNKTKLIRVDKAIYLGNNFAGGTATESLKETVLKKKWAQTWLIMILLKGQWDLSLILFKRWTCLLPFGSSTCTTHQNNLLLAWLVGSWTLLHPNSFPYTISLYILTLFHHCYLTSLFRRNFQSICNA